MNCRKILVSLYAIPLAFSYTQSLHAMEDEIERQLQYSTESATASMNSAESQGDSASWIRKNHHLVKSLRSNYGCFSEAFEISNDQFRYSLNELNLPMQQKVLTKIFTSLNGESVSDYFKSIHTEITAAFMEEGSYSPLQTFDFGFSNLLACLEPKVELLKVQSSLQSVELPLVYFFEWKNPTVITTKKPIETYSCIGKNILVALQDGTIKQFTAGGKLHSKLKKKKPALPLRIVPGVVNLEKHNTLQASYLDDLDVSIIYSIEGETQSCIVTQKNNYCISKESDGRIMVYDTNQSEYGPSEHLTNERYRTVFLPISANEFASSENGIIGIIQCNPWRGVEILDENKGHIINALALLDDTLFALLNNQTLVAWNKNTNVSRIFYHEESDKQITTIATFQNNVLVGLSNGNLVILENEGLLKSQPIVIPINNFAIESIIVENNTLMIKAKDNLHIFYKAHRDHESNIFETMEY